MMEWKDETSYSQSDKAKIPRVMQMELPHGIHLIVHRLYNLSEIWFFSIKWNHQFLCKDRDLSEKNLEKAQEEAIGKAAGLLNGWSLAMKEGARKLIQLHLKRNPCDK